MLFRSDEGEDEKDDESSSPNRRTALLATRALRKINKQMRATEAASFERNLQKMERVIVRLSESEMRALVGSTQ